MTPERILVPTDFSETSESAVKYAVGLAEGLNASLHFVHVLERDAVAEEGPEFPLGLFEGIVEAARQRLTKVVTEEQRRTFHPECTVLVGSPFLEIVRYAEDRDINLIVMGTHGRGFVTHMLMGSVAEKMVRKAPCPVLTMRHPNDRFILSGEAEQQPAQVAL